MTDSTWRSSIVRKNSLDKLFGVAFGEYQSLIVDERRRAAYSQDQMRGERAENTAITWVAKMYGPTIAHMVTMADDKGKF